MARPDRSRTTTGLVVAAAVAAVVLSVFAVNRSGQPTEVAAASTSAVTSTTAPVTTGSATPSSSPAPTTTRATTPATTPPATTAAPSTTPQAQAAPPAAPTVTATYTVQPGDNLSVIAAWFKLNGYGDLYEANKAVLGANPNLIYPGQVISLSANGVSMTTAAG